MTFTDQWQLALASSYAKFAALALKSRETIDITYGFLAAAILQPASQPVKQFNLEAIRTVQEITQVDPDNNILRLLQNWNDDDLVAARRLATEAQQNSNVRAGLKALIDHFDALASFSQTLTQIAQVQAETGVSYATEQIKAGLVNLGGTTNIQALTLNLSWYDTPVPPAPAEPAKITSPLPYEPECILIPAGPFLMGNPQPEETTGHWRPHTVHLPAYKIGKYPIVNQQYAKFVEHDPERRPRKAGWRFSVPPPDKLNHPVVGITWYDALAYCLWLSQETGRKYRLPTEAEWEKAARGGQDDRRYPWGNELRPDCCNYQTDGTTPVDQYELGQSPYGCYDMVGNVWEWTSTLWGNPLKPAQYFYPYQHDERENLNAPATIHRVYRGGAYNEVYFQPGCTTRLHYVAPDAHDKNLGFRVVLEI